MKKPSLMKHASKKAAKKATNVQPVTTAFSLEIDRTQRKRREIAKTLPCASELAALAATVEPGKSFSVAGASESARKALILWEACHEHLETAINTRVNEAIKNEDALKFVGKIEMPEKFPATLADFARLVVGGKDSFKTYRAFIGEHILPLKKHLDGSLSLDAPNEATLDEVAAAITIDQQKGFSRDFYIYRAQEFLKWKPLHDHKAKRIRASKGGVAKQAKKLAEKQAAEAETLMATGAAKIGAAKNSFKKSLAGVVVV